MTDKINPSHYQFGDIQVIQLTRHLPFCEGNVVKYCSRAGNKPNESKIDDLLKAKRYLDEAIDLAIQERARAEALRHGLRCDGDCTTSESCVAPKCPEKAAKASQLQICESAGEPVGFCSVCVHRVNCEIRKNAQSELDSDDIAEYHTSVPEAITRAGRTRKVL